MGFTDIAGAAMSTIQGLASLEEKHTLLQLLNEAHALRAKNHELQDMVLDLQRKLAFQGTLRFDRNVYWSGEDRSPFCSGCWDGSRKAVRLSRFMNDADRFRCPVCDKTYALPAAGREEPPVIELEG
jgi:hypothetical protein